MTRKKTINRYRVVRCGTVFLVQQWFDRFWWWKAGWYTYCFGDPWQLTTEHPARTCNSREEAATLLRHHVQQYDVPAHDVEPLDYLDPLGERLREAALAADDLDDTAKLMYADWCDEHGLPNNAARIRIELATLRRAQLETMNATSERTRLG